MLAAHAESPLLLRFAWFPCSYIFFTLLLVGHCPLRVCAEETSMAVATGSAAVSRSSGGSGAGNVAGSPDADGCILRNARNEDSDHISFVV